MMYLSEGALPVVFYLILVVRLRGTVKLFESQGHVITGRQNCPPRSESLVGQRAGRVVGMTVLLPHCPDYPSVFPVHRWSQTDSEHGLNGGEVDVET